MTDARRYRELLEDAKRVPGLPGRVLRGCMRVLIGLAHFNEAMFRWGFRVAFVALFVLAFVAWIDSLAWWPSP